MTTVQAVLDEIRDRPGTGDVIPVFDPSTEEQIAEFTDCGPDAVNAAVVINTILILLANLIIAQIATMFFPTAVA